MTTFALNRRISLTAASLGLLAVISGCARPVPGGREPGPEPGTYSPDDVVLQIEVIDGFLPFEYRLTRLPIITVYGDGRVITQGPRTDIYPAPALPNVLIRQITAAGVDALVVRALDHGVGSDFDFGIPFIMDAPGTRFTVLTDSGVLVTDVVALYYTDVKYDLTEAQQTARLALHELMDDLRDLPKTLGPDAVDEQAYEPTTIAAISREWTDKLFPNRPDQTEMAWPGPTLPGRPEDAMAGLGCLTVSGTDLASTLDAAESANEQTPWTSDGHRWWVGFRPLLPHETSCDDLI